MASSLGWRGTGAIDPRRSRRWRIRSRCAAAPARRPRGAVYGDRRCCQRHQGRPGRRRVRGARGALRSRRQLRSLPRLGPSRLRQRWLSDGGALRPGKARPRWPARGGLRWPADGIPDREISGELRGRRQRHLGLCFGSGPRDRHAALAGRSCRQRHAARRDHQEGRRPEVLSGRRATGVHGAGGQRAAAGLGSGSRPGNRDATDPGR